MNRLEGAESLYLRQHATNPVDWWPFGDAAFAEARRRDVPVFISVGYAACHWCHVMAHECFEDPQIAALLNDVTVPVKVDREERPDVDAQYMSAVQAMTGGQGGWPMTVFTLADGRPFFAGTYFPPADRYGRPGLPQVLRSIASAWAARRDEVHAQAAHLTDAVRRDASVLDSLAATSGADAAPDLLGPLVDALAGRFDPHRGGFSGAPKFPHPAYVEACAAMGALGDRPDATAMAKVTLDAMARGGLFDHIAGGFARYSVDDEWHVPHFEKMLCDQALLARCYLRAAAWCDEPSYEWVARRTLDFVRRTMRVDGGFASAIDADAGGREGAHIVLTRTELAARLSRAGLDARLERTARRYRIDDAGPIDGACVPRLADGEDLVGTVEDDEVRRVLCEARALGPAPAIDDKVLLEWNAMLASVLAEAAWRLGDTALGEEARVLVARLAISHRVDGTWRRRSGPDAPLATSADLAWLIDAAVSLFELDGDAAHLTFALDVLADLVEGFFDGPVPTAASPGLGDGLFQSHAAASGLLVRAKDTLDGATPSGAGIAAVALARLALATSDDDIAAISYRLIGLADGVLRAHPQAAASLVEAACYLSRGIEVAVPGPPGPMLDAARRHAPPFSIVVHGAGDLAILRGRDDATCYICRHAVCRAPIREVASVSGALATAART